MRGPGIKPGTVLPQVSGNVDIAPTMLFLAGGEGIVPAGMDGKNMAPFLVPEVYAQATGRTAETEAAAWRQHFVIEYKSVGTYYNDHSAIWSDATFDKCASKGPPRAPGGAKPAKCDESCSGVGCGNCYFVDSTLSNNWRELRVISDTEDLSYVEYDPAFTFNVTDPTGAGLQFYELYDLSKDPYQVNNLYAQTDDATKTRLHGMLQEYFECKGKSCP